MDLRDEYVARGEAELAAALAHMIAHRRLGDVSAVLVDEAPPDPLGRVTLLARRLNIRHEPLVDQVAIAD